MAKIPAPIHETHLVTRDAALHVFGLAEKSFLRMTANHPFRSKLPPTIGRCPIWWPVKELTVWRDRYWNRHDVDRGVASRFKRAG